VADDRPGRSGERRLHGGPDPSRRPGPPHEALPQDVSWEIGRVSTPQSGIFALGTASHAYLEFDLAPGKHPRELVTALANLREPRTTIGGVNLVSGFRPELWRDVV